MIIYFLCLVQTTRLANLIDDGSESHHDEVLMTADPKAFWPQQTGIEMFDIATVCLRHKPKLRPPMEQVHYITVLMRASAVYIIHNHKFMQN